MKNTIEIDGIEFPVKETITFTGIYDPLPSMKTMIFKNIPKELHGFFKVVCAGKGITMRQAFIQFMVDFCK